jgi:hypothetical protein
MTRRITAKPARLPTTLPTTWGVLGGGGPVELVLESEFDPVVEPGVAAAVPVSPAAAPATVLPEVPCGEEPDMLVEKVVLSDRDIKLETCVRSERVLVVNVLLK